jgi:prepilin-type N-terminal cleavage/methylation domain-containing protein
MLNKIKKDNKGFTIIEVLIVLAIAGLILLVVFLAVPALQRNSRNTQVRNAASTIAGAGAEFIANNNGKVPTTVSIVGDTATISSTVAGTSPNTTKVTDNLPASAAITIVPSKKCKGNGTESASTREFVVTFKIESGGSATIAQCIDG